MAIDGTWKITSKTPIGEQVFTAELTTDGETLTGSVAGPQGTHEITDGTAQGNDVSWVLKAAVMGQDLKFKGTIDGDDISGEISPGAFGSFPASGSRV